MKRVLKAEEEPTALTEYKTRFDDAPAERTWSKFKKARERRDQVKKQLRTDQRGLCAYCENTLIPDDESVEHFVARSVDHGRELDWANLLLCCAGGERPLPEAVADGADWYDPQGLKTCGHAKLNSREAILNPLNLPHAPRLFRFRSETGEIEPDEAECRRTGIEAQLARNTIRVLGLKARRLNEARLSLITALVQELAEPGDTEPFTLQRERELAAIYLPEAGFLPAFFTTLRFVLGAGAEGHLASIVFQG